MNKSLLVLMFGLLLISAGCFAQEKSPKSDEDDKLIKGTDYSYYQTGPKGKFNPDARPQRNVVKVGITKWLSGVIPFYYERRLAPFVSLQVGLGITARDFIADGITQLSYLIVDNEPEYYNNYAYYRQAGRKASVGFYVSLQPKFYPNKKALANFFISPMLEFKRFDYTAQYANNISGSSSDPTYSSVTMGEYRHCIDFTVNVGRQWFLNSGVSFEIMGGVGFQRNLESRRYLTETYNNSAYWTTSTTTVANFRPEFNLDLNVGGFF